MDEQAPKPAPTKSLITPSRVVLLILLAVAVGALAVDVSARRAATAANAALEAVLDRAHGEVKAPTRAEVHQLLGREPDAEQPRADFEEYTWRGALKDYKVYARYTKLDPPTLRDVYLNQAPD